MDPVQKELNTLVNALFDFAKEQLQRRGEFFPFAAVIAADGQLRMVAVQMDEERPQSTAVIDELYRVLRPEVEAGAIRAAGVCMDVFMTPPGGKKSDAVRADLEHGDGYGVSAFLPYRKKRLGGGYEFGELHKEPFGPHLFADFS